MVLHKTQKLYIMLILLALIIGFPGCRAQVKDTPSPGPGTQEQLTQVTPSSNSAGTEGKYYRVILSTENLLQPFTVGIGNKSESTSMLNIPLGELTRAEDLSFWMVHPFYEPRRFTKDNVKLPVEEGLATIKLSELSQSIPSRSMKVEATPWGYRVGPYPSYVSGWSPPEECIWAGDMSLLIPLSSYYFTAGAVILDKCEAIPFPRVGRECNMTLSNDGTKLAYLLSGRLVVRDLITEKERDWPIYLPSDAGNVLPGAPILSWSADNRYILVHTYPSAMDHTMDDNTYLFDYLNGYKKQITNREILGLRKWSPDSSQVLLYKCEDNCFHSLLLLDIKTASFAPVNFSSDYTKEYNWDAEGRLQPVLPNHGKTRAALYDPKQRLYHIYEGELTHTELHLLDAQDRVKKRIDLKPTLKDAGLPSDKKYSLKMNTISSPCGQFVFMEGELYGYHKDEQGGDSYWITGAVDLVNLKVKFLSSEIFKPDKDHTVLNSAKRWSGSKVILRYPVEDKILRIVDAREMKLITPVQGQKILGAFWAGEGLLYITPQGAYLACSGQETKEILTAPAGEEYIQGITASPNARYLAIPRERRGEEGLRWITLDILDLESL